MRKKISKSLKHYRKNRKRINARRRKSRKLTYNEPRKPLAPITTSVEYLHAQWRVTGILRCEHYPAGICCAACHADKTYGLRIVDLDEGRHALVCCQKLSANSESLGFYDHSEYLKMDECCHGFNTLPRERVDYVQTAGVHNLREVRKLPHGLLRTYVESLIAKAK
jgi:hypothetical protein